MLRLNLIWVAILLSIGFFLESTPANVSAQAPGTSAVGDVMCMPGIYLTDPQDCLPVGPSAYLTEMAKKGITFPLLPLPARSPDPLLSELPFRYALLQEDEAAVYATLEDALAGAAPATYIQAGDLKYISYIETVEENGKLVFHLKAGGWVVSDDVATRISYRRFQGVEFKTPPQNSFGWVIPLNPTIETKRTPGFEKDDYTGHLLTEYDRVQIYSVQKVGDIEWYMVGVDEWVEQRLIGRVTPNAKSPEGVTNGRWIEVNLFEQTLAVYDQNRLVFATLIATGLPPFWTRPGLFPIYKKLPSGPMSGAFEADRSDFYYLEDVPWTMYYDEARALHGAYWRTRFGFPQSHGCVNLSPGDSQWIFNWAQEGDWVYVWDPSGETPTDPEYYTPGGA